MGMIASQITNLAIVYSIVYPSGNQRKHQSSASLAFVQGIHRWPMNSPHKWPVTRKMFPFDDVIMRMTRGCNRLPNNAINYFAILSLSNLNFQILIYTVPIISAGLSIWFNVLLKANYFYHFARFATVINIHKWNNKIVLLFDWCNSQYDNMIFAPVFRVSIPDHVCKILLIRNMHYTCTAFGHWPKQCSQDWAQCVQNKPMHRQMILFIMLVGLPLAFALLRSEFSIQIKICAEYRDMLTRPRLVYQEPGLRPIGRSPGVPDKSSRGLSSISRYPTQILIRFIAYIFHFFIPLWVWLGTSQDCHHAQCPLPFSIAIRMRLVFRQSKFPACLAEVQLAHENTLWHLCHRTGEIDT